MRRNAILVLACNLEKYNDLRIKQWDHTVSKFVKDYDIYYLFGKSDSVPYIPKHPHVYMLQVNTGDFYEDIPHKIYEGFKTLSYMNYDYIIKMDDTITINSSDRFTEIVNTEIKDHAYISLNGAANVDGDGTTMSLSSYHFGKTLNKVFNTTPVILLNIPYAGGPCYALRKDALLKLNKMIIFSSLYEDYSVGLCMFLNNIKLHVSKVISENIIFDKLNPSLISLPFPIVKVNTNIKASLASCWKYVVPENTCTVLVHGGLGNQLFQIAMGIEYACKNNMKLKLCTNQKNVRPYYWDSLLKHYSHLVTNTHSDKTYKEPTFSYNEIPTYTSDIVINGYFQTSKYFQSIRSYIRNIVSLPNISDILTKYRPITNKTVFVHARRGDYKNALEFHGIQDEEYYKNAISHILEKIPDAHFMVSSDEPDFWKSSELFKGYIVDHLDEQDTIIFTIMTNINNFIIANSSFSWWGAVISNASTVIAPKNWFGPTGPKDIADIYEPSWIIM